MGSNVSKETELETISAYTFYGIGLTRCCTHGPHFLPGAPQNDSCGTSCTTVRFDPPQEYLKALGELEKDLEEAAEIAREHVKYCSHVICPQMDSTAGRAAEALNESWCRDWNKKPIFQEAGLKCNAESEVFGFGRSRVTYLVIRVARRG